MKNKLFTMTVTTNCYIRNAKTANMEHFRSAYAAPRIFGIPANLIKIKNYFVLLYLTKQNK